MIDAITGFFGSESFIPHGHCFLWTPSILYTWVISDIAIFLSYSAIPLALLYIMRKRADIPFNGLVVLFAAFILCCGLTHLMGAWTIWNPQYGISSMMKAVTAMVSVATAVVLWPLAPTLIAIPSVAQLRTANEKLEKTTGQLRMANQNLEQFATMASHDLRSPLKSIINLADLAVLHDPDGENQALQQIRGMAEKMESLVDGYRRLSRITLDEDALATRAVSDFVRAAEQELGQPMRISVDGDASILADEVLFTQLFVNLLGNALAYGAEAKVDVRIEDTEGGVQITLSNPIHKPMSVDDTIFAPFRRLTNDGEGMGLGLAICDRICQLHGGTIVASSEGDAFSIGLRIPHRPQPRSES